MKPADTAGQKLRSPFHFATSSGKIPGVISPILHGCRCLMKTKLTHLTIRQAESPEDLEKLYRFRYRIYVEEMGRHQRYADHAGRRVEEPLDATAAHFIAVDGEKIVGCLRWNSGLDTDFGEYVELYQMHRAGPYFPAQCGTTTKVMVAPEYRRTGLVVRLCQAGYTHARSRGLVADFMDCNPHLEEQFAQFGYRPYRSRTEHPEYGDVLPMLLLCPDLEHLQRVRSPLATIEAAHPRHPEAVDFFHQHVLNHHHDHRPQATTFTES